MALRADFTQADLERFLDDNRVDEIECLVPDLTGVARGKILPRTKFTQERGMRLAESVLAMTVTGEEFVVLPDVSTAVAVSVWLPGTTEVLSQVVVYGGAGMAEFRNPPSRLN